MQTYIGRRVADALDGRFGPLAWRRCAPAGRRHPRPALPREAPVGQRRARCGWTSSAGARCWSSSGTSAARARCARSPTSRRGTSATRRDGLRVVTVHSPGFAPGEDEAAVRAAVGAPGDRAPGLHRPRLRAVARLRQRGLAGALPVGRRRPPRRVPLRRGRLRGDRARDPGAARRPSASRVAPLHPEDEPSALIVAQTPDQPGAYSGPYAAGAVWAVLGGAGELHVNGERVAVDWPGRARARRPSAPRRGRPRPAGRRRA